MRKIRRSAEWGTPLDGICIRPVGVATLSTCWHEVPLAPSLRELLSEREAEGVSPVGFSHAPKSFESVGEALSLPHPPDFSKHSVEWHTPHRLRRKDFIAS